MEDNANTCSLRMRASMLAKVAEITSEASVDTIRELPERKPFDYAAVDFFSIGHARCMVKLGIDYC
eukprot:686960-Pyramimonas_sp.AAC.1